MTVLTKPTRSTIVTRQSLTFSTLDGRPTEDPQADLAHDRPSERSSLVFQVLLGAAACLALAGVVQAAETTTAGDGPSDGPPAVFVQTD